MSQAGVINTESGPVPPDVPTNFVTDDGTAIPALNILNVNGTSTTDDNDNGIQTLANGNLSNNLEIQLTNRIVGSGISTNASVVNLVTFALDPVNKAIYRFHFDVVGRETTSGDGVGYTVDATFKTNGTSANLIASPYIDSDEDPLLVSASITMVDSGNDALLQVTGVSGKTIDYKAVGTYLVI